jgi:hypothetical protein
LICWVALTKLLIKQNNVEEDPEQASDYLAMHVFNCNTPGEKVLSASKPLIKSVYMSEQTVLLKIQGLDKAAYLDQGHLLNICLDQTERKRDLFYKLEIYSSHDFTS